jgi:hypothetical protein
MKIILDPSEVGSSDEIQLKFIASLGSFIDEDEEKVIAEIGAVAPLSDTLRVSGGSGMTPSSRDRISVDLRGLRAALFERARARNVSPSRLVRDALADALGPAEPASPDRVAAGAALSVEDRVRLTMRMSRAEASATLAAARRAGLAPGALVAGLVAEVPALSSGFGRADHIAALIASSGELSTLSRNIRHLTRLLREGNVHAALEYRDMLVTLDGDIRGHLTLASSVLADLRPRRPTSVASKASTS